MKRKLSKVALYTWREAKAAMIRKYKKVDYGFYLRPRHLHHKEKICKIILEDPSITI